MAPSSRCKGSEHAIIIWHGWPAFCPPTPTDSHFSVRICQTAIVSRLQEPNQGMTSVSRLRLEAAKPLTEVTGADGNLIIFLEPCYRIA